jgi:hypothetical protein
MRSTFVWGLLGAIGLVVAACSDAPAQRATSRGAVEADGRKGKSSSGGKRKGSKGADGREGSEGADGQEESDDPNGAHLPSDRFAAFLKAADQLSGPSAAEAFAALNFKTQAAHLEDGDLFKPAPTTGRCLLFATGNPFTEADAKDSAKVALSDGGRLAVSADGNLAPALCEGFFRETMTERFTSDFYAVYVSFYGVVER